MSASDKLHEVFHQFEQERLSVYDVAKLLGVDTQVASFGPPDEQIIFKRVIEQLKKIPYIPFPVALHTVDIILTRGLNKYDLENIEVLLGRKKDRVLFQFLGGFLDPGETAEYGCTRELMEESGVPFRKENLHYLGSLVINDSRYADSVHKITSSIYAGMVDYEIGGKATGKDDIVEVKWVPLKVLKAQYPDIIAPLHIPLFELFMDYLNKRK